ncbi:hypothetical protein K491DRAFT_21363 [Lophiostoma macrostomum CBS 122681]|uniref:SLC26A/SulP transporter domain-containing protein n=1 Tax=Lophiostoma macrostomum CBS 122681 TaxID=1314788 RepID=A0A6A6T186_9PLEO|nr:hypothetical protein K491DRAFT_21363 [Lophiostoma macrostomum CBS 122681]
MLEKSNQSPSMLARVSRQMANLPSTGSIIRSISPAAILLGLTLNVLDAVSMGLLIFPSAENGSTTFAGLQTQAMSLYVMSTIISQLSMTFGGSLFPGALGSMFLEVLPFLRAIATSIQDKLGEDHPGVLPTVMATYALTSLLVGVILLGLGMLRCGRLVEYFPATVLSGAIGAIGVSLFILGLELTIPTSSQRLSLKTAEDILFNKTHLPLLVASVGAAAFLSLSLRLGTLFKLTRGFTQSPLYVPMYCFFIAGVFWIVVAAAKYSNAHGLATLRSTGWLFTVETSTRDTGGFGWNYWALFDFSLVQWSAITVAFKDIALLVLLAVVSLPIYIPAMALTLNVPEYNMNWELLGHGVSNTLAAIAGTVPNLVFFTNSRFFTLAGGGRIEAVIVTALTAGVFFFISYILPYIPTILAATLVIFLGIELTMEAVWKAPQQLTFCEFIVVLATVLACTFLGFVIGVGTGLGAALVLQLWWSVYESRPKIVSAKSISQISDMIRERVSPYSVSHGDARMFASCNSFESQRSNRASEENAPAGSHTSMEDTAFDSCSTLNDQHICTASIKGPRDFTELSMLPTAVDFLDSCSILEAQSNISSTTEAYSDDNLLNPQIGLSSHSATSSLNNDPIDLLLSALRAPPPSPISQPIIVKLTNYVGFVALPEIEAAVKSSRHVIIDFTTATRAETCVAQFLCRQIEAIEKSDDEESRSLVLVGVKKLSGLHADLRRGGVECAWMDTEEKLEQPLRYDEFGLERLVLETRRDDRRGEGLPVYQTCTAALESLRLHTDMPEATSSELMGMLQTLRSTVEDVTRSSPSFSHVSVLGSCTSILCRLRTALMSPEISLQRQGWRQRS